MSIPELYQRLGACVSQALDLPVSAGSFEVASADPQFGDFATNLALIYARSLNQSPRQLAERLIEPLQQALPEMAEIVVAGPGFINMTLKTTILADMASQAVDMHPANYQGQEVVMEYSDPNPFKILHVGHLYTTVVGDALSNLMRRGGAKVHAVNFGGDVGLHVAKALWGITEDLGGEHPDRLAQLSQGERSEWMARCYVRGNQAYEEDQVDRAQIVELNKRVYQIHEQDDHESDLAQIYWTCRRWSYDYFEAFYRRIGSRFEKYYPESSTTPAGVEAVQAQLKRGVYERSEGAVVFKGEPYGLHTRVFITSQGLPTYETKDLGLVLTKWHDYQFDLSVVVTAGDITDYMKVLWKSLEQFEPELAARNRHITHGNVKLAGGMKMSSRRGNFLPAAEVLDLAAEANRRANQSDDAAVALGAVKYAFLRQRIGADLIYVPEESVSLEGNSGPYLQYAHARARSILAKAGSTAATADMAELDARERGLARMIADYPSVVQRAVSELLPHYIATYLYELAQGFNRFYEGSRVLGDPRQLQRLRLVAWYADVLKDGLGLLGIAAPDRL